MKKKFNIKYNNNTITGKLCTETYDVFIDGIIFKNSLDFQGTFEGGMWTSDSDYYELPGVVIDSLGLRSKYDEWLEYDL